MTTQLERLVRTRLRDRIDGELTRSGQLQQQLWGLTQLQLLQRPRRQIGAVRWDVQTWLWRTTV